MNVEQIRQHIDELIRKKGKNYRALSMAIGKNEAYLHQYINKGSPLRLPEEQRRKLAKLLETDEQELTDITLPKTLETSSYTKNAVLEICSLLSPDTEGFMSLPLTQISAISSASPENIKIFAVSGDSMQPTLKDGDYIFVDTSVQKFSSDGLYVVIFGDNPTIRRMQQISQNEVLLISDNTNYKQVTLPFKKLNIIGKVVYAFKSEKIA